MGGPHVLVGGHHIVPIHEGWLWVKFPITFTVCYSYIGVCNLYKGVGSWVCSHIYTVPRLALALGWDLELVSIDSCAQYQGTSLHGHFYG